MAKSAEARRREDQAMQKFQQAREKMENRGDLVAGTEHTVELLQPSCHLTSHCWVTFYRHVRSFGGWVAKRRKATAQEKKQHKETRNVKVYFVDVVFNVPKEKQASVGVDDQVAGGATDGTRSGASGSGVNNTQAAVGGGDGSRSEGVNQSVEIQAPAQGGNRDARVCGGACSGNDKMKVKINMEIELSTAQFIAVAHVLPTTLGAAANAE